VQRPVEAVVVVRHGGEAGNDQLAAASHLGASRAGVDVLPEDGVVFLVDADAVHDRLRFTVAVQVLHVEVADLAEAVAAEFEARGEGAGPVLTPVEEVLAVGRRVAVEVRNVHLVDGGTLQHGALDLTVEVVEFVEHETLAVAEAHPEGPVLPGHLAALDGEAGALRLHDVEG
jgi:hypothetical protein